MRLELNRRRLIKAVGAASFGFPSAVRADPADALKQLELKMGGRLGVFVRDSQSGRTLAHRADERFPMCSTFKALLVAAVLEKAQSGALKLDQKIAFGPGDLLEYAPTARAHVAEGGLDLESLCAAAVELSDNTAANLLLNLVGGPAALTARLRAWGDRVTRLDRNEPTLNSAIPGDPRDTTSPRAMASSLERIFSEASPLDPANRAHLKAWMGRCQTGKTKLRAGLPTTGYVGDKTGNNGEDTCGDNAVMIAPGRKPIFISVYLTQAKVDAHGQDAVFVDVARLITREFLHG